MFSSRSSAQTSPSSMAGMELHPLSSMSSKQRGRNGGAVQDDIETGGGAFVDTDVDESENDPEDEVSSRYHRVDSIDEFGSERAGLMPVERGIGKPILPPDNNLDVFFREMYEYYSRKGFGSIVTTAITNLSSMLFTILTTTFLLTMLNWSRLAECRDDASTCQTFSHYIDSPFSPNRTSLVQSGLLFGSSIALLGWAWAFSGLFFTFHSALKYRSIYRVNGVVTRDLQTMQWSRVVSKLKEWQNQVFYVKNDMQVNALTIALRVLRKENYKIAFYCMNVLPLGSPDWPTTFAWVPMTRKHEQLKHKRKERGSLRKPKYPGSEGGAFLEEQVWWMGNALETNLDLAIFNQMIDDKTFALRKDFTGRTVRNHLRALAILNLIFLPLIFLGTLVYFFFRYAEEFHSKRNYLGPRWWTPHSLWILREFNELPHVFQRRLNGSLRMSEKYLRMFPSPVPLVLARGAAFILGGLVAILLVFALVDDAMLLRVSLFDRNLVWYAAVLSSALAAARAIIPPPEEEAPGNPNVTMRTIAAYTHLLPDHWRGRAHTYDVKEQFDGLFPFRVHLLLRELICVVCTPYLLWFVLPPFAEDIVKFLRNMTSQYPGVGDVCTLSLMNLEEHGDPKWNMLLKAIPLSGAFEDEDDDEEDDDLLQEGLLSETAGRSARSKEGSSNTSRTATKRKSRLRMDPLVDSKLEKSWIAFKIQYSAENCGVRDALGEDLLRRIKDFRETKKPLDQTQAAAKTLMSSSLSGLDGFQLVPPGDDLEEEELQAGAGDEIFWFLEQFRDEEMRKRTAGL